MGCEDVLSAAQLRMKIGRLLLLGFAATASGCAPAFGGLGPGSRPAAVFDAVWKDFDRNYSFFGVKQIDWDAAYARYKPRADAASTMSALVPVFRDMFRELNDPHVEMTIPPNQRVTSVDWSDIHTYFDAGLVFSRYVTTSRMTPSRNMRYGVAADGVGYVWIATFSGGGWAKEMDAVLDSLKSARGIVVDIRNNSGGSSSTSTAVAGRFVDARRVFSLIRWRNGRAHDAFSDYIELFVEPAGRPFTGKIAVLTNRLVVSASESFVLAMRSRPDIQFVGDTTAGGFGNPLIRELPNGWVYRVPQWIQYGPAREQYEGVGLAPTVVVRATAADSIGRRDVQLERAIELVRPH